MRTLVAPLGRVDLQWLCSGACLSSPGQIAQRYLDEVSRVALTGASMSFVGVSPHGHICCMCREARGVTIHGRSGVAPRTGGCWVASAGAPTNQ